MNVLMYAAASIASASGLIIGVIIGFLAKEEMKPGRKYFELFQKGIWLVIFAVLLHGLGFALWARIVAYIILIVLLLRVQLAMRWTYPVLGIILFLSSRDTSLMLDVSLLILLYGFATGSLFYSRKLRDKPVVTAGKTIVPMLLFFGTALLCLAVAGLISA